MKALQNNISACELDTLNSWLEKSPANKAKFVQMKKMWNDMNSVSVNPPVVDIKKEWELLEQTIKTNKDRNQNKLNFLVKITDKLNSLIIVPKYINPRPAYAIAAFIILIAASILIYQNIKDQEPQFQTFTAANMQKVDVKLSDGSSIKLNSGSSITVQDEFADDKREVRLHGEAYFNVTNENRPCIILTDNAKIEVLGTSFNVWARNNQTRVIVKEGIVRLSSINSKNDFVLIQANQISRVIEDSGPHDAERIQAERFTSWSEGRLVFEHCPLHEFIGEIERQYNIEIHIQPVSIKDLKLSGTFDNLTIDQVLSSICLTFHLECDQINQDKYILRQN
jgi:ferric-dicitrate binding protein FerR (iron transport regulator)